MSEGVFPLQASFCPLRSARRRIGVLQVPPPVTTASVVSLVGTLGSASHLCCKERNSGSVYCPAQGLLLHKQKGEPEAEGQRRGPKKHLMGRQLKKKKGKKKTYSNTSFYA